MIEVVVTTRVTTEAIRRAKFVKSSQTSTSVIFVTKIKTRTRIIGRHFQRTRTRIIVIQKTKTK